MARVTNLGINIFSHWNGRGMRQARRNLRQLDKSMGGTQQEARKLSRETNRLDKSNRMLARSLKRPRKDLRRLGQAFNDADRDSNRFRRGIRAIGRALVAPFRGIRRLRQRLVVLGDELIHTERRGRGLTRVFRGLGKRILISLLPALLPIIGYLTSIAIKLTAVAAAAAIGFGGFSALALAASRHALQLAEDNKKLSKSQRRHVNAVNAMKKAWHKFLGSKTGGRLLKPLTIGIKAITRNMGKLKPLVNAIAPVFNRIARRFADWMDRSNGFKRFVNHMKKHGVPIMKNLATASRHVLNFLGRAFRQSLPGARKLSRRIKEGAKALRKWGQDGGFKRFLKRMTNQGPKVRKLFRQIGKALPKILKIIQELAPVSLKLATAFAKIINNMPPWAIKALVVAWLLYKPVMIGAKLATFGMAAATFLANKRLMKNINRTKGATKANKKWKNGMKKAKGVLGKLGSKVKTIATTAFGFLLGKIKGKFGLIGRFLRLGGVASALRAGLGLLAGVLAGVSATAAAVAAAIAVAVGIVIWAGVEFGWWKDILGGLMNVLDNVMSLVDDFIDVLKDLGGVVRNVAEDVGGFFGDALDFAGDIFDSDSDKAEKTAGAFSGLGKAAKKSGKATNKYAKNLKNAGNQAKGAGNKHKKSKKHISLFGRSLHIAGGNAKKFGKNAGKSGRGVNSMSDANKKAKKKLMEMGLSGKQADKALKSFGKGAVGTGKKVKNQAGKHFKNGAKNVRKSWDNATTFIRRTTRKRFDKVIHHTRAFRNKLGKQFKGIAKAIRRHFGKATESVKDNARKDFNKAEKQAKQARKTIGKQFHRLAGAVRKHWGKATESIVDNARKRFNKAEKQAKQFRKTIGRQFERAANAIRKHWGKVTESVVDNARKRFNKTTNLANKFRKNVGNVFEKVAKKIRKTWSDVLDNVKSRTKQRLGEIRKTIESALKKMQKAFKKTTDAIKKIWQGRLPDIFKKPVKFFVNTVYNKGLRKAWNNTFANLPGIKELKGANVGFASGGLAQIGGKVRGPGGPTADKIPAALSAGEFVVRAKAVREIGVDTLQRINQGVGGDLPKRGVPIRDDFRRKSVADSHFANGGMLGSRQRHNQCSAMRWAFADGGFLPMPSININEVYNGAIKRGVKAAKKSKMLGATAGFNFGAGNMSNGDESSRAGAGGFDWGTNLYQDVAAKVAKKVLHPFMNMAFHAANKGSFRPTGEWGEVAPTHLKGIMPELIAMVVAAANVGCGSNGYAPFRPWKSGDGARVNFRGVRLNKRTADMCRASEKKLRKRMSYFQGSWSHASASAGTHAGGGAVDTGPASFKTSAAMRASGFAAWARGSKFGSGSFSPHVHGIAVGDKQMSGAARAQVKAFFNGKDGLAGNRPDNQPGGGGACMIGGSGVKRWAPLACTALKMGGCGCSPAKLREFLDLMRQESGGNPRAQNNWDSNARAGNASRGLMQVIPTTFRANHVRGTSNNIFDPLANMAASVRYIKRQYGCRIPNAPYAQGGIVTGPQMGGHPRSMFCSGGGVGMLGNPFPRVFDRGGTLRPGFNTVYNGTGGPERLHRDGHGDGDCTHIHIHGNVFTKNTREFRDMVIDATSQANRRGRRS